MTTKYDQVKLQAIKGDTEKYLFTTLLDGAPQNLTGYTVGTTVKERVTDTDPIITVSAVDGQNGSVFASGIVAVVLSPSHTALLADENYFHTKAVSGGTTYTISRGIISGIEPFER